MSEERIYGAQHFNRAQQPGQTSTPFNAYPYGQPPFTQPSSQDDQSGYSYSNTPPPVPPKPNAFYPTDNTEHYTSFIPPSDQSPPKTFELPIPNYQLFNSIEDAIILNEYEPDIGKWFRESVELFKKHWIEYLLFTGFLFGISAMPYIGFFISFPLYLGIFIATAHKLRASNGDNDVPLRYEHLFWGYLFYLPLLGLIILQAVAVFIGLFLCILPGLYLMVALSFANQIYLEFHDCGVDMIRSMVISVRAINKKFIPMLVFVLITWVFVAFGLLLFGFGILVTFPIGALMYTVAFRDMFGLRIDRPMETTCVFCMPSSNLPPQLDSIQQKISSVITTAQEKAQATLRPTTAV